MEKCHRKQQTHRLQLLFPSAPSAASSNLHDKIGIFNLMLRTQAKKAGLRRVWIAAVNTEHLWNNGTFIRSLHSEMGSKLWQPGLKIWTDMTISFHFLVKFFWKAIILAFLRSICPGIGFISPFKSNGRVCLLRSINSEGMYKLYKHFHVVLGSPSVMSYVHPVHAHLFWHTESPPWLMALQKWVIDPSLVYICAEIIPLHRKGRGKLHIDFRGLLEGASALTIHNITCSAKELKEVRSRDMVLHANTTTSASPATCRSSLE